MDKAMMAYVHEKVIADASIKFPGEDERTIGRDAVMNITGRYFVVMCGGVEIFRDYHKNMEAYRMQSGNGMEFIVKDKDGNKKTLYIHFVQDVKTPRWHNQTR